MPAAAQNTAAADTFSPQGAISAAIRRELQSKWANGTAQVPAATQTTSDRLEQPTLATATAPLLMQHPCRAEQVDIAIVGAGLCGLACAVALHRVRPDISIKVYERQPNLYSDASAVVHASKTATGESTVGATSEASVDPLIVGGGVRLETNGLRALTAISRRLAADVMKQGLFAHRVMLHDTEGGAVITRLHEAPHLSAPSLRQPALVVGWSELQQLLLDQLPPDTVCWGSIASSYVENPGGGVTLQILTRHYQQHQQEQDDDPKGSPSKAQQQQWWQRPGSESVPETPVTPFSDASKVTAHRVDSVFSETTLHQGQLEAADVEEVLVHAQLLVAADGPLSLIRQHCVGDGPAEFDGTIRWVGRLPGDLLSTIPVEYEGWWLGPGMTFSSHPLSGGDVAWEAQVSSSSLTQAGYRWDQDVQRLVPIEADSKAQHGAPDTAAASTGSAGYATLTVQQRQQQQLGNASRGPANPGKNGFVDHDKPATGSSNQDGERATAAAAEPAGDVEAHGASAASTALHGGATTAAEGLIANVAGEGGSSYHPNQKLPVQALLLQLFDTFPAPVRDMIAATSSAVMLEAPVHTRPAGKLPPCLGRGAVAIVGEAAHPIRPTGQECSQSFEDAAELGAAVMMWGPTREALRRLELRRRPRWRHVMQVSQALGSCSNLGGVTLHQGLLDYTSELYRASFIPLRRMTLNKPPAHKRLLRLTGTLLLAWGAIAGAGMIAGKARGAGRDGKWSHLPLPQPVEKVLQEVEEAGKAAGKALGDVAVTAMTAPVHGIGEIGNKLKQVVNVGIKAEHELQHGVGKATHTAVEIAEETAGVGPAATKVPKGKVHGDLPGQTTLPGPVKRFRKAVVGRAVAAGTMVGKPFGKLLKHRVTHQVAEHLGAF